MSRFPIVCALCLLAASGCAGGGDGPEAPASPAAAAAAPPAPTNRVDIPPAVRANLGITFAAVQKRRLSQTLRVPGHFELVPQARHEYAAAMPGRVEYAVGQYERVEAGDVLYRMQSPQWPETQRELSEALFAIQQARADVDIAGAALAEAEALSGLVAGRIEALARAELRRADLEQEGAELEASLPRLRREAAARQSALEGAEQRFDHAIERAAALLGTTAESLRETVPHDGRDRPRWQSIDWIEVRAIEPGVVESVGVTPGGWVETGATVLATVDPSLLRFRATGLQADLGRLRDGLPAQIDPPLSAVQAGAAPIPADFAIGLDADPALRTVSLLARPRTLAAWARPGVSAFLEIETAGTESPELVVPRSAVVQDGLAHVLFRRDPGNPDRAIRIEADMGLSDGRWVVIQSGLKAGDEVVLDGVYELKLATSGQSAKGGHFHADGTFHAEQ